MKDLTGKIFGCLTVVNLDRQRTEDHYKKTNERKYFWECQCDCGKHKSFHSGYLATYNLKSCNCEDKKGKSYKEITGDFWSTYKYNAKRRNLKFDITQQCVWEIYENQNKQCALSGESITFLGSKNNTQTASIDRIDSKIPYLSENVRIVHKDLNIIKLDYTDKEFIGWCSKVHNFQTQKSFNQIDYII